MSLAPKFRHFISKTLSTSALAILTIASGHAQTFTRGNLVVSRSVYAGTASTVIVGQALPPVCGTAATCTAQATDNGSYPAIGSTNNVWNNDLADGNFGVTSPIFLDQITPTGTLVNTFTVPTSQIVTSFSSKSELALNLSADGQYLTFMGYVAPVNTLDASNSNTPGVNDPTNPVGSSFYRGVGQVSANGTFQVTDTNAYSGDNGRAAILANGYYYLTGNSNNGSGTPANIVAATGVQIAVPGQPAPANPTEVGNYSVTQNGFKADKAGKDNNFRGLTIFNNTMYVTKGSGSNGINTVYQVGNAGILPTLANAASAPITILPGFPATLAKSAGAMNPFGIWFADANTLYVADEGDGTTADAATSPNAGLQKWVKSNGTWSRVYVLQNGLSLGVPYSVANYPTSLNPSTDGLRNITGRLNIDGTATIWAVTSTVSANGDPGADPNKLVMITDRVSNTSATLAATEQFTTLESAPSGQVLRGVSFAPSTVAPVSGTYTSTDYPGAAETLNRGIDHFGRIVGWYKTSGTAPSHGFLLQQGSFSALPDVSNSTEDTPTGLNNELMITGSYVQAGENRGFVYSNGYSFIDYKGDSVDYATSAEGIDTTGEIVGFYGANVSGASTFHGFLLFGNTYSSMDFPGATSTFSLGIAGGDSGSPTRIVGYYFDSVDAEHGFLEDVSGFGSFDVPGATATAANGITAAVPNSTIQLVGSYKDASGFTHGFLRSQGTYSSIDFPGAALTIAYGINDGNQIVGVYTDSSGSIHGFVFNP